MPYPRNYEHTRTHARTHIVFYPSSDTRRRPSVESTRVFHFLYVCGIGEYISLDLFCFVNLTSSCSLIPNATVEKDFKSTFPLLTPLCLKTPVLSR